jgi:hypothetical protein
MRQLWLSLVTSYNLVWWQVQCLAERLIFRAFNFEDGALVPCYQGILAGLRHSWEQWVVGHPAAKAD